MVLARRCLNHRIKRMSRAACARAGRYALGCVAAGSRPPRRLRSGLTLLNSSLSVASPVARAGTRMAVVGGLRETACGRLSTTLPMPETPPGQGIGHSGGDHRTGGQHFALANREMLLLLISLSSRLADCKRALGVLDLGIPSGPGKCTSGTVWFGRIQGSAVRQRTSKSPCKTRALSICAMK